MILGTPPTDQYPRSYEAVHAGTHAMTHGQESEDDFVKSLFSIHLYMDSRDWIWLPNLVWLIEWQAFYLQN